MRENSRVSAAKKQTRQSSATAKPRGFISPQLCELVTEAPEGKEWVHEAKLDGYRTQLHVRNGKVTLFSRNGLDWTHRFLEIAAASVMLGDCIIDGEICAVDASGTPSFAGLTDALTSKKTAGLVFYAFDLMFGNSFTPRYGVKTTATIHDAMRA